MQAANNFNITFSSFVVLCVQLAQINEMFGKYDTTRSGRITLDRNQFMKVCLSTMV
jgi:hypothetical protein